MFTDEINLWWLRGPINNWDAARVTEMRIEPGVDGRLLEIYDEAAGDVLELARITVWEPGVRLSWKSSVDDVIIDVRFEAVPAGTRVHVDATVPEGGVRQRRNRIRPRHAAVVWRVVRKAAGFSTRAPGHRQARIGGAVRQAWNCRTLVGRHL